MTDARAATTFRTQVPFRLDRLPWSRWHWTIVIGLGITWILDGLEVTIVGSLGSRLQDAQTLHLSASQIGLIGSVYLVGAVAGALVFGALTDRLGRRKLFLVTIAWYLIATVLTALAWNYESFLAFRFLTGLGIGGEYSAINSTIDELIPARKRGRVDIAINGSWWLGTIIGSAESLALLNPHVIDQRYGWRLAFAFGAVLALAVAFLRTSLPESPRWLYTHGHADEAERLVDEIEAHVRCDRGELPPVPDRAITVDPAHRPSLLQLARTLAGPRLALAFVLMGTQALLYNAIFFTEGIVLSTFFKVPADDVGLYLFPFAIGNLLGPLVLGGLFDTLGRKTMIAGTYFLASALLAITAVLFVRGDLDATTVTLCWSAVFFFASAGASAAYLTTSEIFPVETRALAIAVVYSAGTLVGAAGPLIFGTLVQTKAPVMLFAGYVIGAGAMLIGALVELWIGVDAENRSLEDVASPLSSAA